MTIKNKRVLIAFYDSFHTCPRPKRLFHYLSDENEVDILSKDFEPFSDRKHYFLIKRSLSPLLQKCLRILVKLKLTGLAARVEQTRLFTNLELSRLAEYDYIFVHDLSILGLFKGASDNVVFDAREFYPLMFAEDPDFRAYDAPVYDYWCRTLLSDFPCKITVSELVAQKYRQEYGAEFYNFPSFPLRAFIAVTGKQQKRQQSSDSIRLIYHGAAHKDRNIEKLIELGKHLSPHIELNLMLKPYDMEYFNKLKGLLEQSPRVKLLPPVPFEQIISFIADFDVGIHLLENQKNQHSISLPNKFFEYLGAGLMLFTVGSEEMYNYVQKFDLGLAFKGEVGLEKLAKTINQLSLEDVLATKVANKKASQEFVFEAAAPALFDYINTARVP